MDRTRARRARRRAIPLRRSCRRPDEPLGAIGRLMVIMQVAQGAAAGTWEYLETCPNEACRAVFFDDSMDRSATWCRPSCGGKIRFLDLRRRRTPRPDPFEDEDDDDGYDDDGDDDEDDDDPCEGGGEEVDDPL